MSRIISRSPSPETEWEWIRTLSQALPQPETSMTPYSEEGEEEDEEFIGENLEVFLDDLEGEFTK